MAAYAIRPPMQRHQYCPWDWKLTANHLPGITFASRAPTISQSVARHSVGFLGRPAIESRAGLWRAVEDQTGQGLSA
jgi:hypothetical protein